MTGQPWGRVDDDGTVWVRTPEGERAVGQYPGATTEEALAYFARKFDDLAAQVSLLEQRIQAGHLSGTDAETSIARLSDAVHNANAVGDLESLLRRLSGVLPIVKARRAEAEAARQETRRRAQAERTALVEEAEAIAAQDTERIPWKNSGDRLRELFDQWRQSQRESRLDKRTEDELWKRFSHARTTFDRKRRAHFGALDEQHGRARALKEQIVAEAEQLSASTDWGQTTAAYRDLMIRWKGAGRAARRDDDALWARFRAAQDAFFAARNMAVSDVDATFRENLTAKEALLAEAEALLPVQDVTAARATLRTIQERWEAIGRVPRADLGRIEGRLRTVEQAVRDAEQERWTRTSPQALARAQDAVTQLETTIANLRRQRERARAAGNVRAATEAEQAIQAREEWLAQARRALTDFGG